MGNTRDARDFGKAGDSSAAALLVVIDDVDGDVLSVVAAEVGAVKV